ncbi:MAG: heparinase II/III family protein [Hyphomicrobium sp.]|jgi:uncharacterized heparinase superfamily protein
MARLKLSERIRFTHLAADRLRRGAISSVLNSPPFRWQFGASAAEQLLIIPQDLRTADPSFWDEVDIGEFGLAGTVAVIEDHSPFDVMPPNEAWARELHGFGWLRHMEAAGRDEARETARLLAAEWAIRHRNGGGLSWEPAVTARRLISWISHSGLLLEDSDPQSYEVITESLGMQLVRLNASWRNTPNGYPRLLVLSGLVLSLLSISGHDAQLGEAEKALTHELMRQILPDGGHIGRNPGVLVELMLDLLPLHQCFAARGRAAPPELTGLMQKMLDMLKYMRLGDGMLARFNGMAVASPAGLATVLAYDNSPGTLPSAAPASGYVRLEREGLILILDAGAPPPLEAAGEAHAGCLSFELSVGTELIFVNGGAPSPANAEWRTASRATASHNTLCLGEKSSSKLIRHRTLEDLVGAPPIRFPDAVSANVEEHGGGAELTARHDGYVRRFGLMHERRLCLSANGRRLLGIDRLDALRGSMRLRQDVPFAIHFHLHPEALCHRGEAPNIAVIELTSGEIWRFSLEGALLALEESTYYADSAGPRRALQIVARGATFGETEVRWVVEAQAPQP